MKLAAKNAKSAEINPVFVLFAFFVVNPALFAGLRLP